MNERYNVRSFLKDELENLRSMAVRGKGPFTTVEIDMELDRREELKRKREDRVGYPELSHN